MLPSLPYGHLAVLSSHGQSPLSVFLPVRLSRFFSLSHFSFDWRTDLPSQTALHCGSVISSWIYGSPLHVSAGLFTPHLANCRLRRFSPHRAMTEFLLALSWSYVGRCYARSKNNSIHILQVLKRFSRPQVINLNAGHTLLTYPPHFPLSHRILRPNFIFILLFISRYTGSRHVFLCEFFPVQLS